MARDPAALLSACLSGSERVREGAFRELGDILYVALRRQARDDSELQALADEARQEALSTVWAKLSHGHGPDDPAHFVGWAVVIATNKLREAIRLRETRARQRPGKRVAASRLRSLDEPAGDAGATMGDRLAAADEPAGDAEARLDLARLLAAIRVSPAISDAAREVLIKGYVEGWDDDELAAHLGTTRGNVHVIRCRALARLRAQPAFKAWLGEAEDRDG